MFPPMLLHMRVGGRERRPLGIWLPLFLVWLLLLPVAALVLIGTILADAVLFFVGARYHHYTLLILRCIGLVGAMRGTVISVRSNEANVDIDLV